ncbi:MAG: dihydropteroate synthase [Treponema sp.]|nr:dihydropteroate synthase [Treponema sp.]
MLELLAGTKKITTDKPAFVMGILNATPDSFYSKSRCQNFDAAMKLIEDGADIIDIGGESTRPGYTPISAEEEIKRVIPFVREIRKHSDVPISIDTTKFEVMKAAAEEGADILNDISALEDDVKHFVNKTVSSKSESPLADFCAKNNLSVILMHRFPSEHESQPSVPDIIEEVRSYLMERAAFAQLHGISKEKIIFDPGIGFGKTFEENRELIKKCGLLSDSAASMATTSSAPLNTNDQSSTTAFPILMALSRKRCIGEMTGRPLEERLTGTVTANLFSVLNGAKILRVHDIKDTIDMLNIAKNML